MPPSWLNAAVPIASDTSIVPHASRGKPSAAASSGDSSTRGRPVSTQ